LKEAASGTGKPRSRRVCVERVKKTFGVSERFACRVLGQHRSTQRKIARTPDDEAALTADIIALAIQYGRYGYRRITALLRNAGWVVTSNALSGSGGGRAEGPSKAAEEKASLAQ